MPWQGKEGAPLGPPRAFHTRHFPSSLRTITVSCRQSAAMPKVVCKPEPQAQGSCKSEAHGHGLGTSLPASPFQLDFIQDNNDGGARVDGLDSIELSDVAVKSEPSNWNPNPEASLLGRGYHTQTSLRSTESTLTFYPTHGSFNSGQAFATQQNFPPSDLAWIDEPQALSNNTLFPAHIAHSSGSQPFPLLESSTGWAMGSLTRRLSEPLLSNPTNLVSQGEQPARRDGLRSLSKRKSRGPELELDWEYLMGYESLPGGSSPRGSCLEIETGDVGEEKERRQRRRNNNRESAKRVKEKRDADLKEANKKVEQLQAEQERLMGQCSSMHESCVGLQNDLQALKERWGENQAKNRRLSSELHHLRKNVGLEASIAKTNGSLGDQILRATAAGMPNERHGWNEDPSMRLGDCPGQNFDGSGGGDPAFMHSGGQLATDMDLSWLPVKAEAQTNHDQGWQAWR